MPSPVASAALPSLLIHYLWRIGTHRPRNTHSPHFYFLLPTYKYLRVADNPDCCQSTRPRCQCPLLTSALSLTPNATALTPVPLSVAGQQGSWGCRRPRLLFRAAEADMGKEVSNGIGRLSLIDFTSHILLRHNHHWLRTKYVSCLFLFDKNSQSGNVMNTLRISVLHKSSQVHHK